MAYVNIPSGIENQSKTRYIAKEDINIYYNYIGDDGGEPMKTGRYIATGEYVDVYDSTRQNGYVLLGSQLGWVNADLLNEPVSSTAIDSINQLVKVSVDSANVHILPYETTAVTSTLPKGTTFTATGRYYTDTKTWYRKSDKEWVDSLDLVKTSQADETAEAKGVTKPSAINATTYSMFKLISCGYTHSVRTYPSNDTGKATDDIVTEGKQYTVTAEYTSGGDTWYYLADGSGWFCGKLNDQEISTDLGDCNVDGTSLTSYVITANSLNFRVYHDGSTPNNIYGKFYKGDVVKLVDPVYSNNVYQKIVGGQVLEKWIHVYGKNNKGEVVPGWICVEYTPATTDENGNVVAGTTATYASNSVVAINCPSDLYQTNTAITAYSSPGGSVVGTILKGDDVTLTSERKTITGANGNSVTYAKTADNTWIPLTDKSLTQYTQEMYVSKLTAMQLREDASQLVELQEEIVDLSDYNTAFDSLRVKDTYAVLGTPYQFSRITDCRIDNDNYKFGRLFAEKIVSKFPMLVIMPGVPTFMGDSSAKEKKQGLLETAKALYSTEKFTDMFLNKETRFYTLEQAFSEYFNYVNPLARAGAFFLGIQDQTISYGSGNKPLKSFDWESLYEEGVFQQVFNGTQNCISFFVDSEVTVSDSWGNSTSEPSFASNMDSISESAREINYLIGNVNAKAGGTFDEVLKEFGLAEEVNIGQLEENINNIINGSFLKNTSLGNVLKSASKSASGLIQGAKMIFPELWSDSTYGTEHTVTMKLATPDGDKLSWFMNIWLPMCFWIALVAPRTLTSMHMYHSPFIVNCNYKSQFSCPMGIVTSLQFTKGAEGSWTIDGLPTVVEVSASIKELYTSFAITSSQANSTDLGITGGFLGGIVTNAFMNNNILMDYIANSCGVNINEPDLERDFEMWLSFQFKNKIVDTVDNVFSNLRDWFGGKVLNIVNGIFR